MTRDYKLWQCREHFIPHVPKTPKWFVICGPGSGAEAVEAREVWPRVHLLGLEPSPPGYAASVERWPGPGQDGATSVILPVAVWDRDGETVNLHRAHDLLHSACYKRWEEAFEEDTSGDSADMLSVPCRTLDSLDAERGPFEDVALWADIEGAERRMLKGAIKLFEREAVIAVNLEIRPQYASEIAAFMRGYGFELRHTYFENANGRDEVWIKKGVR